ncbi:MAG: hypothetical protein L3J93_01725 [Thermoplasmata archaeon]|nr:hypothetical protein [Thermoplasmata archaeon]
MVTNGGGRAPRVAWEVLPALGVGVLAGVLAILSGPAAPFALAAVIGALAITVVLRRLPAAREVWLLPSLGVAGGLVFLAPVAFASELLAGALGLGLLYWIALGSAGSEPFADRARGLLLPGAALVLALAATLVLPGGPPLVGIASGLLAAILIGLAYLTSRPEGDPADPERS